ncbi:DUF4232 domain-containing protein [Streptomyces anandii]|uniref:DUF4232 domain-containing protein n=1 Tax=Streptomyces anandii TaxID=285454 RepID=UPI0036FE14FF
MRAKTRLAHSMAVLGVVMAVTACGNVKSEDETAAPAAANCRTGGLKWSLVLQPDRSSGRRDAHLTASNRGSAPCLFAGYPGLLIHNGKANSLDGVGQGHPEPITLRKGEELTVGLQYTPSGAKGAGSYCVHEPDALVSAPHAPESDRTDVPITDTHGHPTQIDACGDHISLSPPRLARG